jgi:predicted homoserine dehydrogenase-like protein
MFREGRPMLSARLGLTAALDARARDRGPIAIGLAGAGQMGTDIVVQVAQMPGLRIGAVSEVFPEAAFAALAMTGRDPRDVTRAATASDIDAAVERGGVAVTEDFRALCAAGRIDVIIDATGNPNVGARIALEAFAQGKPVVMLNVEADITIGRQLRAEAARAGVVCTGAAGDEPACTLELIAFAQSLGMEIVCAGKGKNNPLRFDAMPEDYAAEAQARGMNPRMLVEFVDGSKTMIEMTAIAQATGLLPDRPGMHGPAATREDLAQMLCTEADGGLLGGSGRVDYSIGKGVAPGVFVVVKPRHPRIAERLTDLKVGPGPCYSLIRPYHLTSIEVPLSAARAVLTGLPDMEPIDRPTAECATLAKRDLAPGERLGKIGERDYRAHAVTWADLRRANAVPLGLAEGAVVTKPVKAGALLTYDNCAPDESLLVTQLRRQLDADDDARFGAPA